MFGLLCSSKTLLRIISHFRRLIKIPMCYCFCSCCDRFLSWSVVLDTRAENQWRLPWDLCTSVMIISPCIAISHSSGNLDFKFTNLCREVLIEYLIYATHYAGGLNKCMICMWSRHYCLYFADEKSEVHGYKGRKLLDSKAIIFYHTPEGTTAGS